MVEPGRGVVRWVRSLWLTLAVLSLSVGGHALAGGSVPSTAVLLLAVGITPVVHFATRHQVSLWHAGALLGLGQVMIHLLLLVMTPTVGRSLTGGSALGHHDHLVALPDTIGVDGFPRPEHLHLAPVMVVAHLAATVSAALLITWGEQLLWTIVRRLLPSQAPTRVIGVLCRYAVGSPRPAPTTTVVRTTWGRAPPAVLNPV